MVKECFRKAAVLLQLLLCLLILAGIVFYTEKNTTAIHTGENTGTNVDKNAPSLSLAASFSITLGDSSPTPTDGSAAQPGDEAQLSGIRLWQDETDENFYLFLPSYARDRLLTLSFGTWNEALLDGTLYRTSDMLSLEPGIHTLSDTTGAQNISFHVLCSSGISTVYTHTASGSLDYLHASKENYEGGQAFIVDENGKPLYSGSLAELSGHGNSSWFMTEKRSFQMKFPEQVNLFDMGAARNWLLISNAFDPSLLRNYITYDLAQEIGLEFSPESVFVDWYADGEYQGSYLLCEKIEVENSRVAISDLEGDTKSINKSDELFRFPRKEEGESNARGSYKGFLLDNPADITGGYLLSLELNTEVEPRYANELSGFVTYRNQAVVVKRPACASMEQVEYIRSLYQSAEDAIMEESGFNPETGFYYTHYIDVRSFALKYMIEEITKNMDAQYSSQFFYKKADSVSKRLFAGPVWDYDRAWGTSGTRVGVDLEDPNTFYANQYTYEGTLWYGLYQQETFRDYVKRSFQKNVLPALSETLDVKLDALSTLLSDSALMNDYRWHVSEERSEKEKRQNYLDSVYYIKNFGKQRMDFLKREWCD